MPPKPQTDTTVKDWSLDHLAAMLLDEQMPSEKLTLKDGRIEVQRVVFKEQPCVEKRYLGNLSGRQQYEVQQLQAIAGLVAVRAHVASIYSSEYGSMYSGRESVARTRWHGHDSESWRRLTEGDNSPFRRSVPFLLAWVRGVLKACYEFHRLGFVHCDLLPQNIVIRHRTDAARAGRYTLLLDKPFIFDLEFCLSPQRSGMWGMGQVRDGWYADSGAPLLLTPAWHSEWTCAGEIVKGRGKEDDDPWVLERKYKRLGLRDNDPVVPLKQPFEHLRRVDWGVDLFSLGCALQAMVYGNGDDERGAEFRGEHSHWNDPAHKYLLNLPKLLRSHNKLAPEGGVPRTDLPHRNFCDAIDRLIGTSHWDEYSINLPERFVSGARAANPMLTTLDEAPWNTGADSRVPLPGSHKPPVVPKMVSIPILNLQVGLDPVTTSEFSFPETTESGVVPKVQVTLDQIEKYLKTLNQLLKLPIATLAQTRDPDFREQYAGFRLLSIDEWMTVCRAGMTDQSGRDELGKRYAYSIAEEWVVEGALRPEHAVYKWDEGELRKHCLLPSERPTGPLGVEHDCNKVNGFGVRGMHGNVWEIVLPSKSAGMYRKCGGAWDSSPDVLGFHIAPPVVLANDLPHVSIGFRVCRTRLRA